METKRNSFLGAGRPNSILIPHNPRPEPIPMPGCFGDITSFPEISVEKSCFLTLIFGYFWNSKFFLSFIPHAEGTRVVEVICFRWCKAWASPSLSCILGAWTSLLCWNLKVQKGVKNDQFLVLSHFWPSQLWRARGVGSFWFVGLQNTTCTCHNWKLIPVGSGSRKVQSVKTQKKQYSHVFKKWKKRILTSHKNWSISATRRDLGPQFKPSTFN